MIKNFITQSFSLEAETKDLDEIRLFYFPIRGRAEIARLILAQAGIAYQDIRIKREDFLKVKCCPKKKKNNATQNLNVQVKSILPYGSLPILEYNGEVLRSCVFYQTVKECNFEQMFLKR